MPETPGEGVRVALKQLLGRSLDQVTSILEEWDRDGNGVVDKRVFIRAFNFLGRGSSDKWTNDSTGAEDIFDELDKDRSGFLDLKELRAVQRESDPRTKRNALPQMALDEHTTQISITAQMRNFLKQNRGQVMTLFRSWDDDEDGTVSMEEFRKAMALMGVTGKDGVVDALFREIDADRSGLIELPELDRVLKGKKDIWFDHSLAPKDANGNTGEGASKVRPSTVQDHKKPKGLIGAMCEAFGYPQLMSIEEYLAKEKLEPYISVPEARVDNLLHSMLPLGDKHNDLDTPIRLGRGPYHQFGAQPDHATPHKVEERKARHEKALNTEASVYGGQVPPPKPLPPVAVDELRHLEAPAPPAPLWAGQLQNHWGEWQKAQSVREAQSKEALQKRRPWERPAEDDGVNNMLNTHFGPRQRSLQGAWHREQLAESRRSPQQRAREELNALRHSTLYSTPNSHVSRGLSHSFSASQLRHSPRSTEISEQRSPSTSQLHHQHASPSTTSCRMSQSQLFATTPPKESASSPRATPNPRGIVHHANLSPTTTHLHARRSSSLAALPHALPPLTAPSSSPLPVSADLPLLAANAILAAKASQPQPFYGPHLLHGVHLLPVPSALLSLAKVRGRPPAALAPSVSAPTLLARVERRGERATTAALPFRSASSPLMPPTTAALPFRSARSPLKTPTTA